MNGSGCTADGGPGLKPSEAVTERQVRRWLRRAAFVFALIGAAWCAATVWEMASRNYVSASIEGILPQDGRCRRPSGRYQDCLQSKLILAFSDQAGAPQRGEVLIPERGVTLKPGDRIQIGYRKDNPSDLEIPDVAAALQTPLGMFFTAVFLLGLERLTR